MQLRRRVSFCGKFIFIEEIKMNARLDYGDAVQKSVTCPDEDVVGESKVYFGISIPKSLQRKNKSGSVGQGQGQGRGADGVRKGRARENRRWIVPEKEESFFHSNREWMDWKG